MRKLALVLGVALISRSAFAFFDPVTISLAAWFTTSIAMPVSYALGCATTDSPPVRLFGTERAVYGLDWGSLACHAENVYGMQMSFCGGSVEESLYGLQCSEGLAPVIGCGMIECVTRNCHGSFAACR